MSSALSEWERESKGHWRRRATDLWTTFRRPIIGLSLCGAGFIAGAYVATSGGAPIIGSDVRSQLNQAEIALDEKESELELMRLELARINSIVENSARHRIPADLAAAIYDIALAEQIDPNLAYGLVRVESGFTQRAVSHMGAVGLTQVMPRTAFEMNSNLGYSDLFKRDTNLHLGFRYLKLMLDRYQGDLRLALLAYNRGPATVDNIRRQGDDPANGYAKAVLNGQ